MTPDAEIRQRFVQKSARLSLWYVRLLLDKGEITAAGIPDALTRRVDLYRLTTLWDGTGHPAFGNADPKWDSVTADLAAIISASTPGETAAMEEAGFDRLWPLMEPRIPLDVGFPPPRPFGFFSYDLAWEGMGDKGGRLGKLLNVEHARQYARKLVGLQPAPGTNGALHMENVLAPRSPFENMPALAQSLRNLLADCRIKFPTVNTLWCNSWLNSHPVFQSLLPASWPVSGVVSPPSFYRNWWGQFMTRTGDFSDPAGDAFRSSGGVFPYPALLCHARISEMEAHLETL